MLAPEARGKELPVTQCPYCTRVTWMYFHLQCGVCQLGFNRTFGFGWLESGTSLGWGVLILGVICAGFSRPDSPTAFVKGVRT